MAHSNQVREFIVTAQGIELLEVVMGPAGIVTGAGRLMQQMQERAQVLTVQQESERRDRELSRRRRLLEGNIANLRIEFESVEEELRQINADEQRHQTQIEGNERIAANPFQNPPEMGSRGQ